MGPESGTVTPTQTSTRIQGWTLSDTSLANVSRENYSRSDGFRIGIYGWRKRCLYALIIFLFSMVIVNLVLTIWIIRVMDFSISGMGRLRIYKDGIRLDGQSHFLHALYASKILSRKDRDLELVSSRNITVDVRNDEGKITNRLSLGPRSLTSFAEKFQIQNEKGKTLFQAGDDSVTIGAPQVRVTGSGGVRFQGSVQTPLLTSEPFEQLQLVSPTSKIHLKAPEGIGVESRAGEITASCLKDLKLQSKEGKISLDSEHVVLRNLKTAIPTTRGNSRANRPYPGIYQLCVCENGRLFLAPPEKTCQADSLVCEE